MSRDIVPGNTGRRFALPMANLVARIGNFDTDPDYGTLSSAIPFEGPRVSSNSWLVQNCKRDCVLKGEQSQKDWKKTAVSIGNGSV